MLRVVWPRAAQTAVQHKGSAVGTWGRRQPVQLPLSAVAAVPPAVGLRAFSSLQGRSERPPPILRPEFVAAYDSKNAPFGFNGLGEIIYMRTYSRLKDNGLNEQWRDTVERVVEGTFSMMRRWMDIRQLGFNEARAQERAEKMFDQIFNMKFLPPGRGLWAMGSPLTEDPVSPKYAALNNCAFVSTDSMHTLGPGQRSKPFTFLMDASMLGVGVGFDVKGALPFGPNPAVAVPGPQGESATFTVPDSREGWVASLGVLIDSYLDGSAPVHFDYSQVRLAGNEIKSFGSITTGPDPLIRLHDRVREVLDKVAGRTITVRAITDIMNLIGQCVVSSHTRQTAEISFGPPDNEEYINLKNYTLNPDRAEFGWASNNSVFCELGMDYSPLCERVCDNGEPGFAWLENMRRFSRMGDAADNKDHRAAGGNPCLEQTLESYEICCLVETFPANHSSLEEYLSTLESAYLYAKTVTLGETHWPETNRVMLRNRRIGCSLSGIAQFITSRGLHELRSWCEAGYTRIQEVDRLYSDEFAIPRSIKTTSIKPSGTVSLLAGATSGMHYPESRFINRRFRLPITSSLIKPLREAGHHIEPDVVNDQLMVVSFPLDYGEGIRSASEVSMWEQLSLAAFLQRYWADNQVSATVTFDPLLEGSHIAHALDYFQYQLKGVSFLPRVPAGSYAQMPLEAIEEHEYKAMMAGVSPLNLSQLTMHTDDTVEDKFCESNKCSVEPLRPSAVAPDADVKPKLHEPN